MALALDQVIPWGRSWPEYERMFALRPNDLARGVLDCGGGPASFAAEAAAAGHRVISVDPLYAFPASAIRARFEVVAPRVMDQVRKTPGDWTWTYHAGPDALLATRVAALECFLVDYARAAGNRYVIGELPALPFSAGAFGLAVCAHLLFLYSDLLTEAFHLRAVLELCRVADEVRLFPLLTLGGQGSPHVDPVRRAVAEAGWQSEVVRVDYELQRDGNQMLRIFQPCVRSSDSQDAVENRSRRGEEADWA